MNKINKSSRESDSRESTTRKKTWTLPSSLDAPPAPEGFVHRWIRAEVAGFEDTGNVSKKLREGYEFVRADEYKDSVDAMKYPVIAKDNIRGSSGLEALCWQGYQQRS